MMTWAPSAAKRFAVARPMPEAPPVIRGDLVRESVRAPGICLHAFFLLNEMALAEFRL